MPCSDNTGNNDSSRFIALYQDVKRPRIFQRGQPFSASELLGADPEGVEELLELDLDAHQLDVQVLGNVQVYPGHLLDQITLFLERVLDDGALADLGESAQKPTTTQVLHGCVLVLDDERSLGGSRTQRTVAVDGSLAMACGELCFVLHPQLRDLCCQFITANRERIHLWSVLVDDGLDLLVLSGIKRAQLGFDIRQLREVSLDCFVHFVVRHDDPFLCGR